MERLKTGTVKYYDPQKNLGFIKQDNGPDVHIGSDSFNGEPPLKNERVKFEVVETNRGLHAKNIQKLEDELVEYLKSNVLKLDKIEYDEFCDNVLKYAEKLKKGKVTTSMIRKIYSRILNAKDSKEIKVLRPHYAYISGRNEKNKILREFMDILDTISKNMGMDNEKELNNFKQFMEAVVAYRKFVGRDQ